MSLKRIQDPYLRVAGFLIHFPYTMNKSSTSLVFFHYCKKKIARKKTRRGKTKSIE